MTVQKDNKLDTSLNQIKADFEKNLEVIDQLKQNADAELLPELEKIEQNGYATVFEIEKLRKKIDEKTVQTIERNTILFKLKPVRNRRTKVGNVWV